MNKQLSPSFKFLFLFSAAFACLCVQAQGDQLNLRHLGSPEKSFDDYGGIFPADFDGDGDYDILTFGGMKQESGKFIYSPAFLWNDGNGGFTTEIMDVGYFTGIPSSLALLDFNNDNSVDIAMSAAFDFLPYQTILLANNGAGSFGLWGGFQSVDTISPHKIFTLDYDNDGDTDILVRDYVRSVVRWGEGIGYNGSLIRNNGDGVFEYDHYFPRLHDAAILDMNGDGRMDIAKTFHEWGFLGTTIENGILLNQGGKFMNDQRIDLPIDKISNIYSIDVNNDAHADLYIRGSSGDGYAEYFMLNEEGNDILQQDAGMHPGLDDFLSDPSFSWGDYNQDNLSDLMISYRSNDTMVVETWIRNEDDLGFGLWQTITNPPLRRPDTKITTILPYSDWFDLNGDGLTDVFYGLRDHLDSIAGHLFRNDGEFIVGAVPVPAGLSHHRSGSGIVLRWSASDGDSWKYNVRVGTTPGGTEITSPMADPLSGFLRLPDAGNAGYNDFYLLDTLPEGKYYWSVQAISKSSRGGGWAAERSFSIGNIYVDFEAEAVCHGQRTVFNNLSQMEGWDPDSVRWDFGDGKSSSEYSPEHHYAGSGIFTVAINLFTGGEVYSATREVVVKPSPRAAFLLEDHCLGSLSSIQNLSEDFGSGIHSWTWDFDDGTSLNEVNPESHGFVNSGTYNVKLVLGSGNGCGDSVVQVVNVLPLPEAELKLDGQPCIDGDFQLSTLYSPSFTYQWKYSGGDIPGESGPGYSPNVPGDYTVVVKSQCGELSDSYTLHKPEFQVLAEGTPCKYSDYRLSVKDESQFSYQWRFGGADIQGATMASYYPEEAGAFAVEVGTACGTFAADFVVELLAGLDKPEIISKGPEVWILVCSNDSAAEYQWFRNDLPIQGETEPVYIPGTQTGSYLVQISDGSDCFTSSDAVQIPPATAVIEMPFKRLKIYPNPSSGVVTLEMDNALMGEVLIDIFAPSARKVIHINFQKETAHLRTEIDLSAQPAGAYVIGLCIGTHRTERVVLVE